MTKRGMAAQHLAKQCGNYVSNDENGRRVERVDMVGGKYLAFDEHGRVSGFMPLSQALDFLGLERTYGYGKEISVQC